MAAQQLDDNYCRTFVLGVRREAEAVKQNRMMLNSDNFSMYQLEHDFSHKQKHQSKEVLGKTRLATENIKSFFQQALVDLDDWHRVCARDSSDGSAMKVKPEEAQKLLNHMLKRAGYYSHVGNSVQNGLLGSLMVSKVHGCMKAKPKFVSRKEGRGKNFKKHVVMIEDKTWELEFDIMRQENYYPDPSGYDMFEVEDCWMPLHIVKRYAEGDEAIYDKAEVDKLQPWNGEDMKEQRKANETGENLPTERIIPRVKITELWGDVIDQTNGDILAENVVITLANDQYVIRKPTSNPLWHQRSPIIAAAMIEVANSVWGIAMMDAGTKHNRSLIEIFNLMLDSAMKSVWGINQLRVENLTDAKQVQDGIPWGTNLKVDASLPVGGKVLEPLLTGTVPPEAIQLYNLLNQEAMTSMMTNDMRMGAQSFRQVKATEVAAAENSITSVFQGMAKNVEEKKIQPELELAWQTIAQNWDLIDKEIFVSLFGRQRGEELATMDPQDVFVETVNGLRFEVFGISLTLRRQADFRKWTTLLQVIGGSEVLIEAFLQKYSFEKFLGEVMTALDIDKLKISAEKTAQPPGPPQAAPADQATAQPGGAPGATPNMMSQVPTPKAAPANPLASAFAHAMPSGQG